ncbi:thiol:disulfide interchange protein [Acetobacter cerevisiae]|uniref:Thiol:disulfide interchange protein n=1 Tax=Acetobacter cerevisiae TaxID=178900 RepID=A0A149UPL5_9PROT|nr:hypothetical protein [Acetobacter cerevisiae]KXV69887.1 thiol:disulfide interchange protein [Acetobacter cerevisiae]
MLRFYPFALAVTLIVPTFACAQQCAVGTDGKTGSPSTAVLLPPAQHENTPDTEDALKHLTGSGARLSGQGVFHGFETGVAYTSDRVFVYFMPKGRRGVLGGTAIPVPYDTLRSLSGKRATDLEPWQGIRGMFLQNGTHFQVIYAAPDGQAAIAGSLWDASGRDITRQQIQHIPGAVPTVHMDNAQITETAPSAVMLIDPQCMYSIRAAQNLMPLVQSGKLHLKVVPLSVLDYEDRGESTLNAKAMLSYSPRDMVRAWIDGHLHERADSPSAEAADQLESNGAFAKSISLKGTPTFLWIKKDGALGRFEGNPTNKESFLRELSQ